jgi:DNA repair protein RadC
MSTPDCVSQAIKYWLDKEKPRERFLASGPDSLSDAELLAIIIGSGTKGKNVLDISRELLNTTHGFSGLEAAQISDICKIKGLSKNRALQIKAALEIGRRFKESQKIESIKITDSKTVAAYLSARLDGQKQEIFFLLLIDGQNRLIESKVLAKGGSTSINIEMTNLTRAILSAGAGGMIIAHNHPSGKTTPSQADKNITKKILALGKLLGVPLLDHLIIGENSYMSFADQGLLSILETEIKGI